MGVAGSFCLAIIHIRSMNISIYAYALPLLLLLLSLLLPGLSVYSRIHSSWRLVERSETSLRVSSLEEKSEALLKFSFYP